MAHGNDLQKKRLYFLKLPLDWFKNARIKKLRKLAGGDAMTIIYLKLLLLSTNHECQLIYEGFEDSIAEELSYKIDEDSDNIAMTLTFLQANDLIEVKEDGDISMVEAKGMIGSETYANVLKKRQRNGDSVGQIPTNVQPMSNKSKNIEIDKEKDIEINNSFNNSLFDDDSSASAHTHEKESKPLPEGSLQGIAEDWFNDVVGKTN